jgi:predicted dienelactone hydrolase
MRWTLFLLVLSGLLPVIQVHWAASASAPQAASYHSPAGSYEVDSLLLEWFDPTRSRRVPVKLYYPKTGSGPFPLIIFSHGLGGSREGYAYLGRHWASAGYVSIHVQHLGSDEAVWRGSQQPLQAMQRAAADLQNALDRPRDVSFAIDQMERLHRQEGPLSGRLDLSRVGVAGHSFGAYTALAVAGETFVGPGGGTVSFVDPRVQAAIPMSAPVPRNRARLEQAFSTIRMPCLHMTGTQDDSPISDTRAADRRVPFDHIQAVDQYLLVLQGGDHMVFSGRQRRRGGGENDAVFQELILQSSLAFWEAYLRHNPDAKAWLSAGGFSTVLGTHGTFEQKIVAH